MSEFTHKIRISGGINISRIVLAATKGVIKSKDKSLLKENGDAVVLEKNLILSMTQILLVL